eukprot:m.181147 g.181147  ORF g.181147 m.181147 type:complete len:89 (+) comp39266_c0_seq11:380-646(+)
MSIDLSQISTRTWFSKIFIGKNFWKKLQKEKPYILCSSYLSWIYTDSDLLHLHMGSNFQSLLPIVSGDDSWTNWHENKYRVILAEKKT